MIIAKERRKQIHKKPRRGGIFKVVNNTTPSGFLLENPNSLIFSIIMSPLRGLNFTLP